MAFTANPEDYTARGKIITPLKDRIGSEIRTHYAATRELGMDITAQEAWLDRRGDTGVIEVPSWVREVVEEIAFQARTDRRIDKRSGVSQRLPISVLENVASNAERRALTTGERRRRRRASPTSTRRCRPSPASSSSNTKASCKGADAIAQRADPRAPWPTSSSARSTRSTPRASSTGSRPAARCRSRTRRAPRSSWRRARRIPGLLEGVRFAGVDDEAPTPLRASAVEFILEGLAATRKIGRTSDRGYQAAERRRRAARRGATSRRWTTCRRCRGGRRSTTTDSARCDGCTRFAGAQVRGFTGSRVHGFTGSRVHGLMKYRYGKFVPDLLDELDMDELMSKLSDLLLASGFRDPYFSGTDDERTMQALYDAILDALLSGGVLPDERLQQLLGEDGDEPSRQRLEQLIKQIIERMQESGYVTAAPDLQAGQGRREQGPGRAGRTRARPRGSRSPTRRWTSSASGRCATCSARWARAASAATTRATWPPASRRQARPSRTSSATR